MSASIVPHLVAKDYRLMRRVVSSFAVVSVAGIVLLSLLFGRVPNWVLYNFGFLLLVSPAATCGIVVLMKTNVFEREKATQPFIMSLPVTVGEFTRAKLWVNLPIFCGFWAAVAAVGFYFAFGRGLFPLGAVPFVTMVFAGGFLAYCCILAVSLVFQSLGITILAITLFEIATSGSLYAAAYTPQIGRYIWGAEPVWNATAVGVVVAQVLAAVAVLGVSLVVRGRRRDFV